jgi:uncharacterized protein YwgA
VNPTDLVLAIVASLPGQKVKGKKRLQKLAFLLKEAGLRYNARFDIRDYGPFSREIAGAANFLAATGRINESEQPVGVSHTFVTIYELDIEAQPKVRLSDKYRKLILQLDQFSTIDLEVAATYQYFRSAGASDAIAKQKTTELKPTKTSPAVMRNIPKIVNCLSGDF